MEVEKELGRPIHLSLYEPAEWEDLVASDQVVALIANGPKLQLIHHAATT